VEAEERLAERVAEEAARIEAESARTRRGEIEVVVDRLSGEMALAAQAPRRPSTRSCRGHVHEPSETCPQAAEATLKRERAALREGHEAEAAELKAKYVAAIDARTALEARCDTLGESIAAAEAEAESARALGIRLEQELAASGARSDEAAARARSEAEELVAGLRGERTALVAEAERLGKALAEAGAAGAAEVAQARRAHEQEMQVVEVRVRAAIDKKEGAIRALQEELAASQGELHQVRQQLHATQQEILAMG